MVRNAVKPPKKNPRGQQNGGAIAPVARVVEDIVGCKWSLHILGQIRRGTHRPGAIVRSHPKLTTKVMNERLSKMVAFDVLERIAYPEVPPRVEYRFTSFGRRFLEILDSIERLQRDVMRGIAPADKQRERSSR